MAPQDTNRKGGLTHRFCSRRKLLKGNGGADETRTRDLRRDRQAATARKSGANDLIKTTY